MVDASLKIYDYDVSYSSTPNYWILVIVRCDETLNFREKKEARKSDNKRDRKEKRASTPLPSEHNQSVET